MSSAKTVERSFPAKTRAGSGGRNLLMIEFLEKARTKKAV